MYILELIDKILFTFKGINEIKSKKKVKNLQINSQQSIMKSQVLTIKLQISFFTFLTFVFLLREIYLTHHTLSFFLQFSQQLEKNLK